MVMWNQSTFSPPSDMKATCWFSCRPCDFIKPPQTAAGLYVLGLNETEALSGWHFCALLASEGNYALASDHLESTLLVCRPLVTAINPQ